MDTKDTQTVGFRVTAEELQQIDNKAGEAGLGRTDYLRARVFAPDYGAQLPSMEKQLNALTDRLGKEAERQENSQCNHRCSRPEHAKIWGVGYCFDCEMPMRSNH
jgi:hypothetical protein